MFMNIELTDIKLRDQNQGYDSHVRHHSYERL